MKLYHHPLSGRSHHARPLVSLPGLPHEPAGADLQAGAHKSSDFRKLNPFVRTPVGLAA